MAHLKGLTRMRNLNVYYTQFSDVGLTHLKALANLFLLNLTGVAVTDAGVARLKQTLAHLSMDGW